MATLNLETLQSKRAEIVTQSRELLNLARETGKSYVDVARDTIETEVQDVLGKVRDIETRGQALLQERFGKQIDQIREVETELRARAEKLVAEVRPEIESRVPALVPVLGRLETLVRSVDSRLQDFIGSVAAVGLPIENYDELNVREVTASLAGLTNDELETVRAYEAANKNRVTVLREIDTLLG